MKYTNITSWGQNYVFIKKKWPTRRTIDMVTWIYRCTKKKTETVFTSPSILRQNEWYGDCFVQNQSTLLAQLPHHGTAAVHIPRTNTFPIPRGQRSVKSQLLGAILAESLWFNHSIRPEMSSLEPRWGSSTNSIHLIQIHDGQNRLRQDWFLGVNYKYNGWSFISTYASSSVTWAYISDSRACHQETTYSPKHFYFHPRTKIQCQKPHQRKLVGQV